MRLDGDPDGCRLAARELLRAAEAVGDVHAALREVHVQAGRWTGRAAGASRERLSTRAGSVDSASVRLEQTGRRLARFADDLEDLHGRCRALDAEARSRGMPLDDTGWTARAAPSPEDLDVLGALTREAERRDLLGRADRLLTREQDLHDALTRDLVGLHDALLHDLGSLHRPAWAPTSCGDGRAVAWTPGRGDLPPAALAAAEATSTSARVPSAVGVLARHPLVGGSVTAATDIVQGRPVDDAIIKGAVTAVPAAAAGTAAGLAVAGAVAVAPVALPAVVVAGAAAAATVAVSAAAGYVGGRLFDAHGHHLPFVDAPGKRRRRCR